jgi:lactate permease
MTAVAALPIVTALVLLVGLRWPARRAMSVCALLTAGAAYALFRVPGLRIAAAVVDAAWVTLSILLIVFGALFFLGLLRHTRAIAVLERSVGVLSRDARIQVILVGWVFVSFIEGAAGFGTPAAIAAPLLIGLGFRPLTAVVVALIGDSTAVSFGAVGTPMLIGMTQGLALPDTPATLDTIGAIARRVATFDLVLGTVMPAVLVVVATVSVAGSRGLGLGLRALPFALFVGFAQALTSYGAVRLLGPEFPSILGPIGGFAAAIIALKSRVLVPREVWRLTKHETKVEHEVSHAETAPPGPSPLLAFAPYALLLALLVVTRVRALPLAQWLADVRLGMNDVFGTDISAGIQPLYSPGTLFVVCGIVSAIGLRAGRTGLRAAVASAGSVTRATALALFAAIVTVRIFIHSGENLGGHEAMPIVLADALADTFRNLWPQVAPWVGALGSFIAGSATFSNMLFALLQREVATELGHATNTILALQSIGGAAGNMVCIHNVVAACAVAGILGQEGNVIRRTALPMAAYLLLAGALGLVL